LLEVWAERWDKSEPEPLSNVYQDIGNLIVKRGIRGLQYGSELSMYQAALHRQTSVPHDRVYGIQQISGFWVGKSSLAAIPGHTYTLRELEIELGHHLMLSQPHVVTEMVPEQSR
jgi:hypothetical protein